MFTRNGTGKSTLFLALRDNLIPGFPPSVRVLLVSQTESDSASISGGNVDDVALDEISVMDKVISSDRVRAKAMDDFEGRQLFHPIIFVASIEYSLYSTKRSSGIAVGHYGTSCGGHDRVRTGTRGSRGEEKDRQSSVGGKACLTTDLQDVL